MIVFVVVFANYWGLVQLWLKLFHMTLETTLKAPLLYAGDFRQDLEASNIKPSV